MSDAKFDRNMSQLIQKRNSAKTITSPLTIRKFLGSACKGEPLRSVVLNEGLETLGEYYDIHGIFRCTQIKQITLPSTLRALRDKTFYECSSLQSVTFADGSRLEKIGKQCFGSSGIVEIQIPGSVTTICEEAFSCCERLEKIWFQKDSKLEKIEERCFFKSGLREILIPMALKTISSTAFEDCDNLKIIHVEDDCKASLSGVKIPIPAMVTLLRETVAWGKPLLELRKLKEVTIPEGVDMIGNRWFWGSNIESVTIPASVREIGTDAFCSCLKLKRVAFSPDSRLENIGPGSFCKTGIERIVIPKNVTTIEKYAFCGCMSLEEVVFAEGN